MTPSRIAPGEFFRTCQECGHEQRATPPNTSRELSDAYRNAKCRRCKSEALDYGTNKPLSVEDDAPTPSARPYRSNYGYGNAGNRLP